LISILSLNYADISQINSTRQKSMEKAFPDKADMEKLSEKCEKLTSFKANVLRSKTLWIVEWEKVDGKWTGGVKSNMGSAT